MYKNLVFNKYLIIKQFSSFTNMKYKEYLMTGIMRLFTKHNMYAYVCMFESAYVCRKNKY